MKTIDKPNYRFTVTTINANLPVKIKSYRELYLEMLEWMVETFDCPSDDDLAAEMLECCEGMASECFRAQFYMIKN